MYDILWAKHMSERNEWLDQILAANAEATSRMISLETQVLQLRKAVESRDQRIANLLSTVQNLHLALESRESRSTHANTPFYTAESRTQQALSHTNANMNVCVCTPRL
ncbi:hypothetical protein BU23DRAFT_155536 [Bimuria novae-zelandiae CBS 107.79]|uniref:Uncharacterized protein n=1 Tax=Bimuria novae-zelandiae CBS 107.79 TaxID=1447943 RepID=A0A6A5V711_9PLEO|nr:hypothetical protein BU23DRAFT_155536 [Bimuria novae-zelandiae CBS 107.79]